MDRFRVVSSWEVFRVYGGREGVGEGVGEGGKEGVREREGRRVGEVVIVSI